MFNKTLNHHPSIFPFSFCLVYCLTSLENILSFSWRRYRGCLSPDIDANLLLWIRLWNKNINDASQNNKFFPSNLKVPLPDEARMCPTWPRRRPGLTRSAGWGAARGCWRGSTARTPTRRSCAETRQSSGTWQTRKRSGYGESSSDSWLRSSPGNEFCQTLQNKMYIFTWHGKV